MRKNEVHYSFLPILAIVLGIVVIAGIFLIPEDIFDAPPPEPTSPFDMQSLADCSIVSTSGAFAIYTLNKDEHKTFLDLMKKVTIDPQKQIVDSIPSNHPGNPYAAIRTNGDVIRFSIRNASNDSNALYFIMTDETVVDESGMHFTVYKGTANEGVIAQLLQMPNVCQTFMAASNASSVQAGDFAPDSRLMSLNLSKAVIIYEDAFQGFGALERVKIQQNIREIHAGAFRDCPRLTEVFFMGEVPGLSLTMEPGIFDPGITIYGPVGGTVEAYAKAEGLAFLPLPETISPVP